MINQCSSCGGFCKKSGCERENVKPTPKLKPLSDEEIWNFWWARPEIPEGENDSMEAEFVAAVRAVLAAYGIKE